MAQLTPTQIYALARSAGFPPDPAVEMTAIALRESSGVTTAHNPKPPDDSYGLWQINMIGNLKAYRMQAFGLNDPTDLYDPSVNAAVAYRLWSAAGGSPLRDWYEIPVRFMPQAEAAQIANGEGPYADPSASVPGDSIDPFSGVPVATAPDAAPVSTGSPILDQLAGTLSNLSPTTVMIGLAALLVLATLTGGGGRRSEAYD
jgi:hypothetical protein